MKSSTNRKSYLVGLTFFIFSPCLLICACNRAEVKEPDILDVRPTRLQVGDTLIVKGRPYLSASHRATYRFPRDPSFRAKVKTVVILEGEFISPDGAQVEKKKIELPAYPVPVASKTIWAERVHAHISADVLPQIGEGKFIGRLGVKQEGETVWSSGNIKLRFFEPSMRSLAGQAMKWLVDDSFLSWLGVVVKPSQNGLLVESLQSGEVGKGSLAQQFGIQSGDVIKRAAGREITSASDLRAAFQQFPFNDKGVVGISLKRAGRDVTRRIPVRSMPFLLPQSVVYLAVMLIFGVIVLTFALVTAGLLTWLERRVAGRIQSRVGPNRVGPQGLLQWLADGVKLLLKEDVIPDAVDKPLFKLAPYLVLTGLLGTFVVLPFGQLLIVSDLNIGLLYLIAITGFVSLGLMMAGWSSNNKWSLLGGMRSAAQIISYEIPSGSALMVPVVLAGTLSTQSIIEHQGGWPWQWFMFDNPIIFACFFIYFISALAEGNRTPFDLPEAESELVAGYQVEYSGWRFAVFMLSEWANIYVIGAVATTVFLGGWQIPGVALSQQASSWILQAVGLLIFITKSLALVFVIIWIRWTLPRFRVDQMMRLCWKFFVPWTFTSILLVALWDWLAPGWLRLGMQWVTFFAFGGGLFLLFFSRVIHNWRKNPEKFSWKPLY